MSLRRRPHLAVAYHAVSSSWHSSLAVSERVLARQLGELARQGFVGMPFGELEARRDAGTLPERAVAITFDDGYASTLRALPVLESLGMRATVFAVVGFVDSGATLRWPGIEDVATNGDAGELRPLSWEQLELLRERGWEVGSHTVSHPRLPDLDDAELAAELGRSRAAIADRLGSAATLAYPYGAYDERTPAAAAAAGYEYACSFDDRRASDRYRRPRIGLYAGDGTLRLRAKLALRGRQGP